MSHLRLRLLTAVAALIALSTAGGANAASPELFFSEYIEGSGNNKALEIYNDTGASINLAGAGYSIQMFFNGSTTAGLTINLAGAVVDGDVYVVAQSAASAAILAQADQTNGSGWFNGDDAVVLRKGTAVIDSIGQIGVDPGSEWGTGLASTADNTLRRKLPFTGDTNPSDAFDPAIEWDGFAIDTFNGLGVYSGVVGDTAPSVAETVPANGATGVAVTSSISVTFSEPVTVVDPWYSLSCSGVLKSANVSGGPVTYNVTPTMPFAPGESCTFTVFGSGVHDVDMSDPPDTMTTNFTVGYTTAEGDPCERPITPIPAIQGSGATAATTGNVTTRGVVVGDYEGASPLLRGFYIQALTGDNDTSTSDGIFVFEFDNANRVVVGDIVTVTGTAGENQGQTQISASTITKCGIGTIEPTPVMLPVPNSDYLERFEGMLVETPQTLYVTEHFQLGRFGQVILSSGDRIYQPTALVRPGAPAAALQASNNLNRLILDDGTQTQNPETLFGRGGNPLSASNTLRGGDTATGLVGVLTYTWAGNAASPNNYRLRTIGALDSGFPAFVASNPRPSGAPAVGGSLKVVGMNLLNFFNTFGSTACTGGIGGGVMGCRGAENPTEFERQWPKTVAAIVKLDADIVGIGEIENDGYGPTSAIQFLVSKLNEATAPGTYAFIDADAGTGQMNALGTDAIKVGLLYKPAAVKPIGTTAALNSVGFVNGGDSAPRNRPALAQAFLDLETGVQLIVSPNHLKSKGTPCDAEDSGDGQANCAVVRTNAANLLAAWLQADPTNSGTENVLIVGDLNSYAKEDPIAALEASGFTNLVAEKIGAKAYSFVFDNQWGYLDYAMGNAAIRPDVIGVAEWHINSDEPSVLDYNTNFKSDGQIVSLYEDDEFRVSDHDPVVVGLSPTVTFASLCTLTKEFVAQPGIANALCAKLNAASRGDARGKEEDLHNYVNQVKAQSGKALTAEHAATLIRLAGHL